MLCFVLNQLVFLYMKVTLILSSSPLKSVPTWGFGMAAQRLCECPAQTFRPSANQQRRRGRRQVLRYALLQYVLPLCYSSITRLLFLPSAGVMQWVTQGLTKVLPQPDDKYKEPKGEQEDHTEVSSKFRSTTTPGPGNGAAKQIAKRHSPNPETLGVNLKNQLQL